MGMLCKIFHSFFGQIVTVFLEGAPAVTAKVIDVDDCSVLLLATSGSEIFIPFERVTAVQGFPLSFPAAPVTP
jgi:hypothetical protein